MSVQILLLHTHMDTPPNHFTPAAHVHVW